MTILQGINDIDSIYSINALVFVTQSYKTMTLLQGINVIDAINSINALVFVTQSGNTCTMTLFQGY